VGLDSLSGGDTNDGSSQKLLVPRGYFERASRRAGEGRLVAVPGWVSHVADAIEIRDLVATPDGRAIVVWDELPLGWTQSQDQRVRAMWLSGPDALQPFTVATDAWFSRAAIGAGGAVTVSYVDYSVDPNNPVCRVKHRPAGASATFGAPQDLPVPDCTNFVFDLAVDAAGRSYVSDGRSHLIEFSVNGVASGVEGAQHRAETRGLMRARIGAAALAAALIGQMAVAIPASADPSRSATTRSGPLKPGPKPSAARS
jgi:hypothetical protein